MLKRLVNTHEEITFDEIAKVAQEIGLSVYVKVRVADVLPVEDGRVSGRLLSYALKAHFDFVVCRDEWEPYYVVEFDGPSHQTFVQRARDAKKDELCRLYRCPILRVNSNHVSRKYRDTTLLAWIMEVQELEVAFCDAQQKGRIPGDEPFDPMMFPLKGSTKWPYWLSLPSRIKIQNLNKVGKLCDMASSGCIGRDKHNILRGFEFIRVTPEAGLFVETSMRPQNFPLRLNSLLEEILVIQLADRIEQHFSGKAVLAPLDEIYRRADHYRQTLLVAGSHWCGPTQIS